VSVAGVGVSAPRVVVIGAGLGGLAAGIRLAARGFRVTIVERGGQAGGRAGVFVDQGFTFDTGPTLITAPFLLDELWALAGRRASSPPPRSSTASSPTRRSPATHVIPSPAPTPEPNLGAPRSHARRSARRFAIGRRNVASGAVMRRR